MGVVKNIYTDIDLKGNELKNFRVSSLDDDPEVLGGGIYYNTKLKEFRVCIAGKWVNIFCGWYFDEEGNLCTDKQVIIRNNLIVEGETASGGDGQDTPASGTVTGIRVDANTVLEPTAGIVDMSDVLANLEVDVDLSSYATHTDVNNAIAELVNGAPTTLDTLKEIADALAENEDVVEALESAIGTKADKTINITAGTGLSGGGTLASNVTLSLATSGVTAGTYPKVTVDKYGRVTAGATLVAGDIPALAISKITGLQTELDNRYTEAEVNTLLKKYLLLEATSQTITGDITINGNLIVTGDTSSGGEGSDTPASGTVTGIKVNGVTYEPTAGIVTIPDYPTSLTWEKISGRPTKLSQFTDDVVSGNYLPLTGGTIASSSTDTPLTIKNNNAGGAWIGFNNANGNLGYIGYSYEKKLYCYDESGAARIVLHSGIIGSYALPLSGGRITGNSLDIGREDNYAGAFVKILTNASTSADYGTSIRHYEKSSGSYTYKGLLIDKNGAYYLNNGTSYSLIHSGNIGSQYVKGLATPVTIWGRSFDGTGNVSGGLYLGTSSIIMTYNGNDMSIVTPSAGKPIFGYGTAAKGYDTYVDGYQIHLRYGTSHTDALFLNSSGNVLIGTTTDNGQKFQVNGNVRIYDNVIIGASNSESGRLRLVGKSGDTNVLVVADYNGQTKFKVQNDGVASFSDNVGIGTTSPGYKLDVAGNMGIGTTSGCNLILRREGVNYITAANALYLTTSGSITALALFADGTAQFSKAVTMSSTLSVGGNITPSTTHAYNLGSTSNVFERVYGRYFDTDSGYYLRICAGGNERITLSDSSAYVGINNTSPSYGLDVSGTGRFTGNLYLQTASGDSPHLYFQRGTLADGYYDWDLYNTGGYLKFRYVSSGTYTEVLSLYASEMKVTGNGIFTGDTSSGSDIRFKDRIEDMAISLKDMANAPLFTFKWNDREDEAIHLGSSAQYWEKVCPWLVTGEDFKSLNYATLGVAMGISLAKKAVNHEARIKALEKENNELREKIRRIEYGC